MITTKISTFDETQMALAQLNSSKLPFHLTGSHYFGNASSYSDFDFFTENTAEAQKELRDIGFRAVYAAHYNGVDIALLFEKGEVQVQLVSNMNLKSHIQRAIKEHCAAAFNKLTKEERKTVWSAMYFACQSVVEGGAFAPQLFKI